MNGREITQRAKAMWVLPSQTLGREAEERGGLFPPCFSAA